MYETHNRTEVPSKSEVRMDSGRAGRRMWNGQKWLQRAGGYSNPYSAIFAPADAILCNTVPMNTGTRNGTPHRSPGASRIPHPQAQPAPRTSL